jgi:hypothetical protein
MRISLESLAESEEMNFEIHDVVEWIKEMDPIPFRVENFCFKEQIAFISDPSPFKTAVCSRRSGKTISCAADLISTALSHPRRVSLYITLSRLNAKRIIWGDLLEINRNYRLQAVANESELSLKFPNGSVVYLSGAKDRSEIEKFRGLAIMKCYIDECQSFRPYIQTLIDDVISKALFDYNGTLCLIGTPGPVPAGYFYDCSISKEWSHHSWTMFENPWLKIKSGKTPKELLERELKRKGITVQDATIQRECFAKWVIDLNALVFRYDPSINRYERMPESANRWDYVIGVDLGYDDCDAIAVLGWDEKVKHSYLVEEQVTPKQGITALAGQLEQAITRYNPLKIVMDTGGLGKKIAEEIQRRYAIPVQAAEKVRKFEYIELLNDAMRNQRFFARSDSRFASDCSLIEWDRDEEHPEKLKISEKVHSDICDAVLYAFRESLHWLSEADPIPIKKGSPAWIQEQVDRMEQVALQALEHKNETEIWGDQDYEL